MSRQRQIDTCFWDDSYIIQMDPSEKLLFLYLLTNPLTTICGVYEISIRRIAFDTGFEQDTVKRMLDRFERDGRCIYRDGWIAMRNWIKHQNVRSDDTLKGIQRQMKLVPPDLAKYVESGEMPAGGGGPIGPLVPNLTKPNLTQPTEESTVSEKPEPAPTLTLQKFSFTLQDGFVGVPHEDMARWRETYPAVNIELEIRRAAEWLRSNPSKMKSNYRRFLTNWFSRTQDRGGTAGYRPPRPASEYKPLAPEAPLTDEERAENLRLVGQLGRKLVKKVRPNVRMKEAVGGTG